MIFFSEIIKDIVGQRRRFLLTVLAIAWSTASISIMLSIGEGLRQHFFETFASAGKSLLVVSPGVTSMAYQGTSIGTPLLFTERDVELIKTLDNVKTVITEYTFSSRLRLKNADVATSLVAVTPEFMQTRRIDVFPEGRFINDIDATSMRRVIVLGNHIAKNLLSEAGSVKRKKRFTLFDDEALSQEEARELIGKTVLQGNKMFTIIGVAKDKIQMSGYGAPDNETTWMPASTFALLGETRYFSNLIIVPKNPSEQTALIITIRQALGALHHVNAVDESALHFWDSYEEQKETHQFFLNLQFFLGFIGFITLLVAGIGITNVVTISVKRATRDIGIRMALGARAYHIVIYYMTEAFVATFIGGAIGFLITAGVVFGINQCEISGPMADMLNQFKPILSFQVIFIVAGLLGLIGFLAAFFPARNAAHIDPAKALQHE